MCPRPDTPRSNRHDLGELEKPLRDRLYTGILRSPSRGLALVSGYRDAGQQWDLRHARVRHGQECNPAVKADPATATPARLVDGRWVGGSDHQRRQAADMGGRELSWLIAHRFELGLGLTVSSERWHFQASGFDAHAGRSIPGPSVPIVAYPGATYDGVKHVAPMARTQLRLGDTGNDVRFEQALLNIVQLGLAAGAFPGHGPLGNGQGIEVNGTYGPETVARVMEYERWHRGRQESQGRTVGLLWVDGITTKPTLAALAADVQVAQRHLDAP